MAFASWENAFWVAGVAGHLALLYILVRKHYWLQHPIFVLLIFYEVLRSALLFVTARTAGELVYGKMYLILAFIDYLLQVALVIEMARNVLTVRGTWLYHTKALFFIWAIFGASVAAALCMTARPLSTSVGAVWEARADLFTTVLTSELFLSLLFVANHLRLLWKSRIMAIGGGLGLWCIASLAGDAISVISPSQLTESITDGIRMTVYLGVLAFWIIFFSFPKREKSPSATEFAEFLRLLERRLRISSAP